MWRWCVMVVWLVSGLATAAGMPEPKVVQLNARVFALLGPTGLPGPANQGYMVNATLILGAKGAILVDTGSSDEVGAHLLKTVRRLTDKPVTHVINTHHHGDHVLGNSVFAGAQIISSEKCRSLVESTGHDWIAIMENLIGRKLPGTRPVPAGVTFSEDTLTEQTIDGVRMVMWVPLGAHSPSDMMVFLPDDRLLVGGDVLVNQVVPVMRDGHVRNWLAALTRVQTFAADAIVPGHGPMMTMAEVRTLQQMMSAFYSGVEAGFKKGLSDAEIRPTLDLRAWQRLDGFETNMGQNINRAYLEVEAASF